MLRSRPSARASWVAVALSVAGCAEERHLALPGQDTTGVGGDASSAPVTEAPASIGVGLFAASCTPGTPAVDWSPVRRISRVEYDNMVRDLIGDTTAPATAFVPESPMSDGVNFQANTYTSVSPLIVQQYTQAAEALAQSVVADTNRLNNVVLPCQTQDDACAQQFIALFASRAFRGQLDATESAGLFQVYSNVKAQFDFPTGIQAVITAVLESPRFLYVLEFGSGSPVGDVAALSSYEVAGRLALFLWR